MARKSNKTAHVLNLLAGHDSQKNTPEENPSVTPDIPAASESEISSTPAGQNISMIDRTESDPVAELLADKLKEEFEAELGNTAESETASVTESIPESETTLKAESSPESQTTLETENAPEPQTTLETESSPEPQTTLETESAPEPQTTLETESAPEPQTASESAPVQVPDVAAVSEPAAEPEAPEEPEFITLNLMDRIVQDKIIYYMRQFDVCTCSRCIADTVALTLNGLPPKYIVTTPAAVDPLVSFYTNKFIADITVEATKACITIKENPRH
ncbi:MAG: late competence development ComFB family protein [Lachnospiraceae bacterium]|nr:late competence development ComFB family protein [Lachnospiraceae bacterium]